MTQIRRKRSNKQCVIRRTKTLNTAAAMIFFALIMAVLAMEEVHSQNFKGRDPTRQQTVGKSPPPEITMSQEVPDISSFGYNLFSLLVENSGKDLQNNRNILVSPYSISLALALVLAGTSNASNCEQEIQAAINVKSHTDISTLSHKIISSIIAAGPSVRLTTANGIWVETIIKDEVAAEPIKKDFIKMAMVNHNAIVEEMPFSYLPIDEYIETKTNGVIQNMFGGDIININFQAVLANAMYFKGFWAEPFSKHRSKPGLFTTTSGNTRKATFMNAKRHMMLARNVGSLDNAHVVRLDYGKMRESSSSDFAAYFLLPRENTHESMERLSNSLMENYSKDLKSFFTSTMEAHRFEYVDLSLPKFRLEVSTNALTDELKMLGIHDAFNNEKKGKLDKISDQDITIDEIFHKNIIEITEDGTETAPIMQTKHRPTEVIDGSDPTSIVFDRPFVMVIMHTPSNTPLFLASVEDPQFTISELDPIQISSV